MASVKSGISHYLPSMLRRTKSTRPLVQKPTAPLPDVVAKKSSKWVTGAKWTGLSALGLGWLWRAAVHNKNYFSRFGRISNNFDKTRAVITNTLFNPLREALGLPMWLAEELFHAPVHGIEMIRDRVKRSAPVEEIALSTRPTSSPFVERRSSGVSDSLPGETGVNPLMSHQYGGYGPTGHYGQRNPAIRSDEGGSPSRIYNYVKRDTADSYRD